jgi:hypothetical protein
VAVEAVRASTTLGWRAGDALLDRTSLAAVVVRTQLGYRPNSMPFP